MTVIERARMYMVRLYNRVLDQCVATIGGDVIPH